MWKWISNRLYQVTSGWVALGALILFVLYTVLVLPDQAARSAPDTVNVGSPDLSLTYSTDDLYRMAEAYGEQGRRAYVRARFTFDLV